MLIIVYLFLSINAYNISPKYNAAINNARIAAFKQSGLEKEVATVKHAASKKTSKWMKDNNLQAVASVSAFVVPVIYNKEITISVKNFNVKVNNNKQELIWTVSF